MMSQYFEMVVIYSNLTMIQYGFLSALFESAGLKLSGTSKC